MKGKFANGTECGLMTPSGPAREYQAATLLNEYAQQGVPANCGDDWMIEHLDLAVEKGDIPQQLTL